jgi:hypothetical protein
MTIPWPRRDIVRAAFVSAVVLAGLPASAWSQDASHAIVCTEQYLPVCGRVGGTHRTYSNACFARAAGAEIVAPGPCGPSGPREPPQK